MTISLYSASIPVFKQMLTALGGVLAKGEAHATAKNIQPDALLQARLFPDMFQLVRQVQIAVDFAKGAGARLSGIEPPKYEDTETTFADLQALLTKVLTYHVLSKRVLKAEIPLNTPNATVQGQSFIINSSLQIIDQRGRTSDISATDIFNTNGVVHLIDKVLLPT